MLLKPIKSIVKRSGKLEIVNAICFAVAILFSILTNTKGAAWLLVVIGLSDIVRFVLCGVWYHVPFHAYVKGWHCPQKDPTYTFGTTIKLFVYAVMILAGITQVYSVEYLAWYGVVAISLFEVIRTFACLLYKQKSNWLKDNDGRIGTRGCTMIACVIAIAINVHLIATNWLGNTGLVIAGFSAVACLVTMDFINPYIYERFTRFYGWLEAFTQKFFWFGHAIAIIIAFAKTDLKLNNCPIATLLIVAIILASIRDVIMIVWHLIGRWSVNFITGRNHTINMLRRVAICGWTILSLAAIIANSTELASLAVLIMLGLIILGIACLVSDEGDIEYSSRDYYLFEEPY